MMLLGSNKNTQRGVVQPQMIFIGLGIVILFIVGFSYSQSKARDERIQALQQKTQETNAANATKQAMNSSHAATVSNVDTNQPEMAEKPPRVDLTQIRMQVEQLSSLYNKFVTVLSNSSNSSERLSNLQGIQSELASVSVDSCLSEAKSNLERGMQARIDGAYDSDHISTAYDQMNRCQNQ
ncbi:hypothetical protein FK216_03305 [Moraxellaceae bacterium AER2_44_116]|nr:hypothetical protein [Moraxellaceae bacterium]TQC99275.1 hypothetical protein FK216_03305 [Moraxellaceae bacterium AER2_44_116]